MFRVVSSGLPRYRIAIIMHSHKNEFGISIIIIIA